MGGNDRKGFPIGGGKLSSQATDEGRVPVTARMWEIARTFSSSDLGRGLGYLPPKGEGL